MRQLTNILISLFAVTALGQQVKSSISRDSILIGEEAILELSLEKGQDSVRFPKLERLGQLEVIENYPVDTLAERFSKRYGLTQFDAGSYTVFPVPVIRDGDTLFSQAYNLRVTDVAVDTTKQKMYPIKSYIEVDEVSETDWSWLWWLLLLIPVGVVAFLLSRKRKKQDPEKYLPPYEWAMYRLDKHAHDNAVQEGRMKDHYTEISYVVRRFLDRKVYQNTLESTTSELIEKLEKAAQGRGISLKSTVKDNIRKLLHRADQVKFAGARMDAITANEDQKIAKEIILDIHRVLPPPTEEELMRDPIYRRKKERQAMLRKIAVNTGIVLSAFVLIMVAWVSIDGYYDVKYRLLGDDLRQQYENKDDWITSSYGIKEVRLKTPDVLYRDLDSLPADTTLVKLDVVDRFAYQDLGDAMHVEVFSATFKEQIDQSTDISAFKELVLQYWEEEELQNIVVYTEEITVDGADGVLVGGTFDLDGSTYNYGIRIFASTGSLQMVTVAYRDQSDNDKNYAELVAETITESIELQPKAEQP